MTSLHDQITARRENNLNAIRLLLALAVIICHSVTLSVGWDSRWSGPAAMEPLIRLTHKQESLGSVAVNLFFFISGMLITASWLHSKTMQNYLLNRVLRIYPGFIVAMAFSALMIWTLCPEFRAGVGHGFSWLAMWLRDCLFLGNASLDANAWQGILPRNPVPGEANGSLWTIPIEFRCYLLVAALGMFCLFKRRRWILLPTLVFYIFYARGLFHGEIMDESYYRFFTYFMVGMCVWLWRDKIPLSGWPALGCLAVLAVTSQFKPWFAVIFPIFGTYCILWLGYAPQIAFLIWTRKTDISYGTYLYAWPIQQMIAMNDSLRHPWLNFLIATPITLAIAFLSFVIVEKNFLAMKNRFHTDFDPVTGIRNIDTRA